MDSEMQLLLSMQLYVDREMLLHTVLTRWLTDCPSTELPSTPLSMLT